MECAEIRNAFVAGRVPAGPEAEAHLRVCSHCRQLLENDAGLGRRLAQAVTPEVPPGELLGLIERELGGEVGARARLRALPLRARAGALLILALALFLFHLLARSRPDLGQYSPGIFWSVATLLGAVLVIGAIRLLRGVTAPLDAATRERNLAALLLLAPAAVALVAPFGAASSAAVTAWGNPSACFTYGAALTVPLVLLYWLFERRDAVPLRSLIGAGALAGLAANLLLHAHCGSSNWGHLLLGHASIGLVWALTLRLVWRSARRSG